MDYTDDEFISAFQACALASFRHADHIRLAWLYSERFGSQATARISADIRRFAAEAGQPEKYHHTMTLAWMRLVDAARRTSPAKLSAHPELLDQSALLAFYSPECLASGEARRNWVEPDLAPLP